MAASVNVMLAVHEKKTTALDLYRPLRHFIALTYSEQEAQHLADDLDHDLVCQMRSDLKKPLDPSPDARRDRFFTYFRALALIEPRFPIFPYPSAPLSSLSFTWFDAFKPNKKASLGSIHLEKVVVLFKPGIVYNQIALSAALAKKATEPRGN